MDTSSLASNLDREGGIDAMARELGVSESQAASGASALLPAILGGFKSRTRAAPDGLSGLERLLERLGGTGLLDNAVAPEPTDVNRGNNVLSQIFGSKEVSRTVARDASSRSGLPATLLKRMLPMLAMIVAGYLSKHRGAAAMTPSSQGGGLGSLLDMDGVGNPLDEILRLAN